MTAQAKRRLKGLAVLGVATVLGLGIWGLLSLSNRSDAAQSAGAAGAVEWYAARVTDFDVKVIATGELEARNQIEVKSKVSGSTAIISVIDEGERVKAGDLLAKLDDAKLITDIEEQRIVVEQATASLVAAQRDLELAQQDTANALTQAQVKDDLAKLAIEKWRNGDVIQKRRELELALTRAERKQDTTARDYELSKKLFAENFISENELDDSELAAIEAQDALVTARQNIEVYNKYTYVQEEQAKLSDARQAQADLERTIAQNQIKLDRSQSDVDSKQRTQQLRQSRLADLERELQNTVIKAPSDGMVVYATSINRGRRSDNPIQQGREVRSDETIIVLPDTSQLVAALRVHESVLAQIKLGQRAAIQIDARPGEPVEGRVTSVGVMAVDGGWINPQLREYIVKVALPADFDPTLKPAMRCTGQIFVGRVEDALAVPIQAVFTEGNRRFVHVSAGGGRVQRVPVTIGRASETLVEITEGIKEGTRVLLRNPRPGEVINEPTSAGDADGESPAEQPAAPIAPVADPDAAATPAPAQAQPPQRQRGEARPEGERRQRPNGANGSNGSGGGAGGDAGAAPASSTP